MTGIVKTALRHPYTFVVMALLILIFGVRAILTSATDIFPNIDIPIITVVWSYTGLPADDMSGRIVAYYERALTNSVTDVEHTESQSVAGYGVVKIYFQPTVNINAALAEVTSVSQTVLKQLPPGITPPMVISYNASSVPVLQIALSSDRLSDTKLYDFGLQFIRPQLTAVPGASIPAPFGGKVRQVQADLNQQALHTYGISANDVIAALSAQNLITPVGTEKIGKLEYTVNLNDSPQTIAEFNDLPVKTVNGTVVYMRDIAYVHDGSPPQTNVVKVDGKNAVLLSVEKIGTASTLDIISGIRRLLPQVAETLPTSLHMTAVNDQSIYVTSAVSSVIREALIAGALTATMILLFIGSWRSTLIIVISIPLAILSSLIALSALGETINIMTLGGLALAVGVLVDDATVTIENVNRHLDLGQDIETAILEGAHEIMEPATVSLLCITIAFVPMFGLGGVAGYLFRPLAEAFVFALVASYVLTYTLVPTLAKYLLGHQTSGQAAEQAGRLNALQRFQLGFEHAFERVRAAYLGLLQLALLNRGRTVAGFLVFATMSFGLVPFLGQDFFPSVDAGQIALHVRARTGMRIEETTKLVDEVGASIHQIIPATELAGVVDNIGLSASPINTAYNNSGTTGPADADMLISLKADHAPTATYIRKLRETLPRLFPGTTFAFLPADMVTQVLNFGTPAPIDIQLVGDDPAADRHYADLLLSKIANVPGIADARIQQQFEGPTLDVSVNRSLAGMVGLNERDAATSILDTLAGSTQTDPTFWLNPKTGVSYPISVQTPQYDIDTMGGLRNIPLTSGTGTGSTQILGGLARISRSVSDASVSHYNVRRVIDIYASNQNRDLGAVASDVRRVMRGMTKMLPRGTRLVLRGQVATMTSAYQQLLLGLAMSIVLIYLVIVVKFQSWLEPSIIISALPMALAGVVWMLFTSSTTLSVPALTGAIMCMGVATANSILVIAFARERMADGADPMAAALEAGATRFRPVLMTALAMIIGMVPMAIEPGQNAPLGRAVIGGLIFATCATLVFVPSLFSLLHGYRKTASNQTILQGSPK